MNTMSVSELEKLKDIIGPRAYEKIEHEAEKEVSLAMQMPLTDKWGKEKYYYQRFVIPELIYEFQLFQEKKLTSTPIDLFNILVRCKTFLACKDEHEYHQRAGGSLFPDEYRFSIPWGNKMDSLSILVDRYLKRLNTSQKERTLLTAINSFKTPKIQVSNNENFTPQDFFQKLFTKLNVPFKPYFDGEQLIDELKKLEPGLKDYNIEKAKYVFQSPSFGHICFGSEMYCHLHSSAWLRTFLNMLRISGFIYPGQIDFGQDKVGLKAPTSPVFLGTDTWGGFCWDEDKKEPWARIPDGCLFLSFGYRGLSDMWIDGRTFGGIEKFFTEHRQIFKHLENPWSPQVIYDVMPTLDILSSATQIPDMGAKVLQVYCCLEHLFVPKGVSRDNKKYIIGGINALRPEMLPWFNDLYKLRCAYAHRGFVLRDEKTHGLITQSIQKTMTLLVTKLGNTGDLYE